VTPGLARFVRFVALGACAAAVNWGSRFAYSMVMPFEAAVVVAYMTGMVVAFVLFSLFVFPAADRPLRQQIGFFVLVNAANVVQVWVVAIALARWVLPALHYPGPIEATAHALAIAVPVFTAYIGHKRLTFRSAG
jgi:putative flippase GtrA